jgi:pantoate--beta-alanine ligase
MANAPVVVRSVKELRGITAEWRRDGEASALVPTMGALHEGHLSLVDLAHEHADRSVVSIFVNPRQFAPGEDLATYPRDEDGDLEKLYEHDADLVYIPGEHEMYPPDFSTSVRVEAVSEGLCGASRPHFFGGVATVVAKLLIQAQCDYAVFGEKDYQQLLVIRRMARDLNIPTEILGAPIVREDDGLAMSSRNRNLSPQDREMAPHLYAVLENVADNIRAGIAAEQAVQEGLQVLARAGFDVDYLELRDARTLEPLDALGDGAGRLFAGAYLGKTRLIDNVAV